MNEKVDFENKDFWIHAIKRSVAKRMIKRGHSSPIQIKDICSLTSDEIENLIMVNKTFIMTYDLKKRKEYLCFLRDYKREDWECKRAIDLNEIDVYEISDGKGQSYRISIENMAETNLIRNGKKIAKNLALIKMTDLGYSKKEIEKILGDDETEQIDSHFPLIPQEVTDKMENHFTNIGINSKRKKILFALLISENNTENASQITGLTQKEIEEYINDNSLFKSDDDESILDDDKILKEMHLWNSELLIECLVHYGTEDVYIDEYVKLSGIDRDYIKKIYEFYNEFKQELQDLLDEMTGKLMAMEFDFDEIEEMAGRGMYYTATAEYYFKKFKKSLRSEFFEAI